MNDLTNGSDITFETRNGVEPCPLFIERIFIPFAFCVLCFLGGILIGHDLAIDTHKISKEYMRINANGKIKECMQFITGNGVE